MRITASTLSLAIDCATQDPRPTLLSGVFWSAHPLLETVYSDRMTVHQGISNGTVRNMLKRD